MKDAIAHNYNDYFNIERVTRLPILKTNKKVAKLNCMMVTIIKVLRLCVCMMHIIFTQMG